MITNDDVFAAIQKVELSTHLTELKPDLPLTKQGLDSMDMATMLLALEETFEKRVLPEEAARLRTIAEITAFFNS